MELFLRQPKHIQDHVLPPSCQKRLAIEMGAPGLWYRFASHVKGIDSFGKSGKLEDVLEYFGFTPEAIANEYLGIR
jgi:transketolase